MIITKEKKHGTKQNVNFEVMHNITLAKATSQAKNIYPKSQTNNNRN